LLSVRLSRGVSRQVVVLAAADRDPIFREVRVLFRGFVRLNDRAFVGPALPVRRSPFPAAPFGFSRCSVLLMGFTPPAILSSGSLPPRSQSPVNRTRERYPECTSPEVPIPYSVRQKQAPVSPGRFQLPAPSVLRVSHPLDVLLRP
jgi:hypothetical protein